MGRRTQNILVAAWTQVSASRRGSRDPTYFPVALFVGDSLGQPARSGLGRLLGRPLAATVVAAHALQPTGPARRSNLRIAQEALADFAAKLALGNSLRQEPRRCVANTAEGLVDDLFNGQRHVGADDIKQREWAKR